MLTSDFGNYSTGSELSEYLSSEIDPQNANNESNVNVSNSGSGSGSKKRSKTRPRTQKKVKYWTLPTMSSGTFNPSMLTARQQLQYLAQKSKLGEESDSLEMSPLRLDRIKFEEMKSMSGSGSNGINKDEATSPKEPISSPKSNSRSQMPSSPSPRSSPAKPQQSTSARGNGSKLKEEIAGSPLGSKPKRDKKEKKKVKLLDVKENVVDIKENVVVTKNNVIGTVDTMYTKDNSDTEATRDISDTKDIDTVQLTSNLPTSTQSTSAEFLRPSRPSSSSFFGTIKGFLYNEHRQKHFETFLKDFAKRLGLSPDDELVKKKREEIINKGMI